MSEGDSRPRGRPRVAATAREVVELTGTELSVVRTLVRIARERPDQIRAFRDMPAAVVVDAMDTLTVRADAVMDPILTWSSPAADGGQVAWLGNKADGIRFELTHHPDYHRRGRWRLVVEMAGNKKKAWGPFGPDDHPERWYHSPAVARAEAGAIADVLLSERGGDVRDYERFSADDEED